MLRLSLLLALAVGAHAAAAESGPSLQTGDRDVGFGIGLIAWQKDGSDASFDALNYFHAHPVAQAGKKTRAYLVDFPTDSEWQISGKLTGDVRTIFDPSSVTDWGDLYTALTVIPIGTGVTMLVIGFISAPLFIAIGALVLGVGVAAMVWTLSVAAAKKAEDTHVVGKLGGTFVLRRQGKKDIDIVVPEQKVDMAFDSDSEQLTREELLKPIWTEVAKQAEREMNTHPLFVAEFGQ